ncbi:MAG: S8 family serine peptidase [Solirubrobacteraceae bacterium]
MSHAGRRVAVLLTTLLCCAAAGIGGVSAGVAAQTRHEGASAAAHRHGHRSGSSSARRHRGSRARRRARARGIGPYAAGARRGLPAARVLAGTRQIRTRVIVVLRNQLHSLPATRRRVHARIAAEASADAVIEADVVRSGGHVYRRYHALNAFAADVSSAERSALASNPQVAAVIPDVVIQLPQFNSGSVNPNAAPGTMNTTGQVCPSDPSKPLLEPEALQTTHTAYADPSIPQAQNLVTGQGVKVAFFADGIDVNNPDLIRPNGTHVIIDYKDFSGEGPSAPSNSLEAFGDASSIAAQGNTVYDLSKFVNPAHPLPPGCNITVRGMAPGASLIAIKVFGATDSAYNSVVLQGLDYALTNDHPDVISESFGGYPIPDSTQDLLRQFNEQAVADGVTVVEGTGDSGTQASPSSSSSDPAVIAAGASTTFQNYAQGTQYGYQFASGGWLNNNVSSVESAGFTQGGRVLDLVAPGEANWALCSTDTTIYTGCTNFAGQPSPLQSFGGTSESTPLIAGGAALVIQAYRQTHGGASPSPWLVRKLLTSTATDLGAPSDEQGAGELNTLAAVQAAESVWLPAAQTQGSNLLVGPTQLDLSGTAGNRFDAWERVTNLSSSPQTVSGAVRQIGSQLSDQTGSVTLDSSSPTFVDGFGNPVPYEQIHFTVPSGADRLVTDIAWPGPGARVAMTLIDPQGRMAAFTRPQGNGNHGEVDVTHPVAGQWTGIVFLRDGSYSGPVSWQAVAQAFVSADAVYPQSRQLGPGETGFFHVTGTFPASAGDSSQDLVFTTGSGTTSIVPIALRSLVAIGPSGGTFSGNLVGGNGRNGAFQPGQIDTYQFQVPPGEPELSVSMTTSGSPGTLVSGTLVSPSGNAVTEAINAYAVPSGNTSAIVPTGGLQAFANSPQPGMWRFVVDVVNPVGGQVLSAPYTGQISFQPPQVQVSGLPHGWRDTLAQGQPITATVTVTNNGPGTEQLFLDPRTDQRQFLPLLLVGSQGPVYPLPIPASLAPPEFLMPTETEAVAALAQATQPITFDFGYGDPSLAAIENGTTAAGYVLGDATPGLWYIAPDELGPFSGPAPAGTVSTGMVALTRGFDPYASTSTGDAENQAVNPNAAAFTPLTLSPGQSGSMTLTITPPAPGSSPQDSGPNWHDGRIFGTLYVDAWDNVFGVAGEVAAIPYSYRLPSSGGQDHGHHGGYPHWHPLPGPPRHPHRRH